MEGMWDNEDNLCWSTRMTGTNVEPMNEWQKCRNTQMDGRKRRESNEGQTSTLTDQSSWRVQSATRQFSEKETRLLSQFDSPCKFSGKNAGRRKLLAEMHLHTKKLRKVLRIKLRYENTFAFLKGRPKLPSWQSPCHDLDLQNRSKSWRKARIQEFNGTDGRDFLTVASNLHAVIVLKESQKTDTRSWEDAIQDDAIEILVPIKTVRRCTTNKQQIDHLLTEALKSKNSSLLQPIQNMCCRKRHAVARTSWWTCRQWEDHESMNTCSSHAHPSIGDFRQGSRHHSWHWQHHVIARQSKEAEGLRRPGKKKWNRSARVQSKRHSSMHEWSDTEHERKINHIKVGGTPFLNTRQPCSTDTERT